MRGPKASHPDASSETLDRERRGFFGTALGLLAGSVTLGAFARRAHAAPQATTPTPTPYLGEIMLFAGETPPEGWARCDGQLLPIAENDALFIVIGTTYGGDGQETFALPDLRGSVPIHKGPGPGLSSRFVGEKDGQEIVSVPTDQLPNHSHAALAHAGPGSASTPAGHLPARNAAGALHYAAGADTALAGQAIGPQGGNQPHDNMQPSLVLNYCIALYGTYPSPV